VDDGERETEVEKRLEVELGRCSDWRVSRIWISVEPISILASGPIIRRFGFHEDMSIILDTKSIPTSIVTSTSGATRSIAILLRIQEQFLACTYRISRAFDRMPRAGIRVAILPLDHFINLIVISTLNAPWMNIRLIISICIANRKDTHSTCLIPKKMYFLESFVFYMSQRICLIPTSGKNIKRYLTTN
jgi:hypothetical protein